LSIDLQRLPKAPVLSRGSSFALQTVALLITPETYHHLVEIGRDTGRFHQLISRMADCALLPFALSLGLALLIVRSVRCFPSRPADVQ
jgi:hypothetical protein